MSLLAKVVSSFYSRNDMKKEFTKGDALPIRYSKRIKGKVSLSPSKGFVKKKTRRSAVKKRTPAVNSSLLTAREKSKVGRRSKSEKKDSKQILDIDSSLPKATRKAKVGTKSKSEKNSKQTAELSKQLSPKLESVAHRRSRKDRPIVEKRKTRNSLNASQINKTSLQNPIDLSDERKKAIDKKNHTELTGNKQSNRRSFRVSKSSLSTEEKGLIKEPNENDLKSPREQRPGRNKCSLQVTRLSSKSAVSPKSGQLNKKSGNKKQSNHKKIRVSKSSLPPEEKRIVKELNESDLKLPIEQRPSWNKSLQVTRFSSKSILFSPNSVKSIKKSKDSQRKKSSRSSAEPLNQEVSLDKLTPKSLHLTSNPVKAARISRNLENRKSGRSLKLSKGRNLSRIEHSEISLSTSAFQSILETPHNEKHSEKRKSSRLLEPSPLRTLNKELSLSTPASVLRKNLDSIKSKSKSSKSAGLLANESLSRNRGRRKLSNNEIPSDSCEKLKRKPKRQIDQHKKASEENFKMPLSKKTENLPVDILSTPAFAPIRIRSISKKSLSKSSKRKLHVSSPENHISSEEVQDAKRRKKSSDVPTIPGKGTLKHKRWLLNNLKEKNAGYEDDIFENQNFGLYKTAFHFGDESDGSSVNIATPKFECILTPTLPKKTPRFKDCISPTDLMDARKTAEEYLFMRNKKRKSEEKPSSSGKNTSVNQKNTTQDIPEKKKLDYEETVNKLIAVKNDLEKDDDEEEDSYFSDVSN